MAWLDQLHRLQPLAADLALLPVGWGTGGKGPMLTGWQHHTGHTIEALRQWPGIRSVGARTGLLTGPLLAFDFDGASAVDLAAEQGLAPWSVITWQIHRDNDPHRLKVLFRPTPEQLTLLPRQPSGSVEFQGKTPTAPATSTTKGEALEVFFAGARQVILIGDHPSTGGQYIWPDGLGPEALTAPPQPWLDHAIALANTIATRSRTSTAAAPSTTRRGVRRLDPCPICGRHSGPGGSDLWCEQTTEGLVLCMPGSTFSAEQRHGPLRIGQVITGDWALVKRSAHPNGEVLTFRQHRERQQSPHQLPPISPRLQRAHRNQYLARLAALAS